MADRPEKTDAEANVESLIRRGDFQLPAEACTHYSEAMQLPLNTLPESGRQNGGRVDLRPVSCGLAIPIRESAPPAVT